MRPISTEEVSVRGNLGTPCAIGVDQPKDGRPYRAPLSPWGEEKEVTNKSRR